MRLVLATEEEAMAWRSWGFSFSRLKALNLDFLLCLSGFIFLGLYFGVGVMLEVALPRGVRFGEAIELESAEIVSSSVLPKGSSFASRSVSCSTFDCAWVTGFFLLGSCLCRATTRSMPGLDW